MCGTCISLPFCRARLRIRFSVVSSRLISPLEYLPFLPFVALADDHHVLLALQDERVDVGGCDRRQASAAEVGKQVQPNPPLELVGRPPAVDGVFGLEIVCSFIEPNPIQLRVHRQAVRDVAFADLQQLDRVRFLGAAARFSDRAAVPVVLDPPDGAALVRHAHSRVSFLG